MDKRKLAQKVIASLQQEVENLKEESKRLSDTAINAPSFYESQHDTTKQELSYEANRIQKRIGMLEYSIKQVFSFIPTMLPSDHVEVGACVQVRSSKGDMMSFLILPFAEGEKVDDLLVLSPQSPIFHEMHGKNKGESFVFRDMQYTIEAIT